MLNLKKLEGPFGIPVYYQKMPNMVRSASFAWLMFTGAADDESIGKAGLYHWFEHVPFRGTKKYPNGLEDINRPIARLGGRVNAWTNINATCFHVTLPVKAWKHGLSVITDLLSEPLLETKSIEAERKIIHQEINERKADASSYASYLLPGMIWPGHPFGHHTLGTEETLNEMNSSIMLEAHKKGYDRNRMILIAIGDIEENDLKKELESLSSILPNNNLPPRSGPMKREGLPAWQSGITKVETAFDSSVIALAFPHDRNKSHEENFLLNSLRYNLFSKGGMSSPLMKIVREERHLVYGTSASNWYMPGGAGFFYLSAEAKRENIEPIIQAFKDTLAHPSLTSQERLDEIKDSIESSMEMRIIDPDEFRGDAVDDYMCIGRMMSDEEYLKKIKSLTLEDARSAIASLNLDNARTLIFEGVKK